MKTRELVLNIIIMLLVIIWVFASFSKFLDFNTFQKQLEGSHITSIAEIFLSYFLPVLQLVAVAMLVANKWRRIGLIFSLVLLVVYTVYIIYILNFAPSVPCSCISIFKSMSWTNQLQFNIIMMLINIVGIILSLPKLKESSFLATR